MIGKKGEHGAVLQSFSTTSKSLVIDHGVHPDFGAPSLGEAIEGRGADLSGDWTEVSVKSVEESPQPFPVP